MKRRSVLVGLGAAALIGAVPFSASAAEWPAKPITMICPWSAGGGTDLLLRKLAASLAKETKQTVVVSNNTGGGGAIGHAAIMRAPADGYTIGMITFELNSLPPQGLIPFTWKDFDPIMRINVDAPALTVKADSPMKNLKDFADYAKAHPDDVTIGNSGPGSVWHIAAAMMADELGIKAKYVPFDGAAPAVTALVGGHLTAVSVSVAEVRSQVAGGNLKMLGVMGETRSDLFPDVPTFSEQGVKATFGTWRGIALPKGVPAETRAKIAKALKAAYDDPEFQEFAKNAGLALAYQNDKDFTAFLDKNANDVHRVMLSLGLAKK
jgi:tripartite-type tricarboxylate transporter receptor subunit TctC